MSNKKNQISKPKGKSHTRLSNAAFTRLTGIKWTCLDCGQTNLNASKFCPGNKDAEGK